eukprot:2103241-Pyramimonas_sp.AAC.1
MGVGEVEQFENAAGARELLRTPKERRKALGLDQCLETQKANSGRQKKCSRIARRRARPGQGRGQRPSMASESAS